VVGRFDEVEDVAGIVVGLPIAVHQDQHLHAAETAGQGPPALGGRLRPQPAGRRLGQIASHAIGSMRLPLRIIFTTLLHRLSSGDRSSTALSSAAFRNAVDHEMHPPILGQDIPLLQPRHFLPHGGRFIFRVPIFPRFIALSLSLRGVKTVKTV
jgi:hypothetical protein